MSEKPNPAARLQSDTINFSSLARNHLAQFAAASAKGYKPVAHAQTPGAAFGTTTSTTANSSGGATSFPTSVPVSNSTPSCIASSVTNVTPSGSASSTTQPATTMTFFGAPSHQPAGAQSTQKKSETPVNSTPFKSPTPTPFDLNTVTGTKFVLLDPYVLEAAEMYQEATGSFQWEACLDQMDRCETFIRESCVGKRVFLVASGGLGAQIIKRINDLPQFHAMYIHCVDVPSHMKWAANYPKVRIVCDNEKNYLIPQLAADVAQNNLEWAIELLKKGEKEKAKRKLEQALLNTEKFMVPNSNPDLKKEIQRRLEECK